MWEGLASATAPYPQRHRGLHLQLWGAPVNAFLREPASLAHISLRSGIPRRLCQRKITLFVAAGAGTI